MNREVRLLFHELLELSPQERGRIYEQRRIGAEVRSEVESLLSFDSSKIDHLHYMVYATEGGGNGNVDGLEWSRCGPYQLIRRLRSSGAGAVYVAQTGNEMQRTFAVTLLPAEVTHASWRERFLRDRKQLGMLNHPSIVPVIDAGHTQVGRPYLVTEYVEGAAIDQYSAGINLRDRLTLFLQVCDAVSYAHRRLVVHRGLSPSNILVDSSGTPKIVDFGAARLLDKTEDAMQTTATDVYSLSALLYKLLSSGGPGESLVSPRLRKDLDLIVRKALRVDPEERYLSVDALANDVRAALACRPVAARTGALWYRARRLLQRRGGDISPA